MPRRKGRAAGERLVLEVADFTGGLNRRVSRFLIKNNQAVEIENLFFGLGGVLKVRPGSTKKTTSALGAGGIKGGVRYYPVGSAVLIADWSTNIYKSTDNGVTLSIQTLPVVLSAYTRSNYLQARDLLFRADGVNTPIKFDGTTWTKWGITGPSTAGTGVETTGGSLTTTATYKWKITFVTATAESNGSTTEGSLTLTGANNKINLSSIPTGGTDVTKRRVYRTKANGSIFYFEEEIPDNVTTVASLDIADSALGAEIPTDKDPPPADLEFVAMFKNRVFGVKASNKRQLFFTDLFEPEAWPPGFGVTIPFPEGDKVTGLHVRGDLLFIAGTSTIFVLLGDSPFNFTIRQTFADEGFVSNRGVVEVENVVMGPTRFGFQAFDGATVKVLSVEIEPWMKERFDLTKLDELCGYYDKENRIVRWTFTSTDTVVGKQEVVFDLFRRAWTSSTRKANIYLPYEGAPDKGELFTGNPDEGAIWQENIGTNDNGSNIRAKYRTKTFDFEAPKFFKKLWHAYFDVKPATGTLAVDVYGDSGLRQETFSPVITGDQSEYGSAEYGVDFYGGQLIVSFDEGFTYDPTASKDFLVKHAEFLFEYNGMAAFELYRLDVEYEIESWLRKT